MSTPATISLHMQNSRGRILSMPVSGILLIEPFELEGTFKRGPTPLQWTGTSTAPSGAQSPVQPDLECLQGRGSHHLSGQPVPALILREVSAFPTYVLTHVFSEEQFQVELLSSSGRQGIISLSTCPGHCKLMSRCIFRDTAQKTTIISFSKSWV